MQKIMFNDKYGLTQAVLEGRKTMTRRLVPENLVKYIKAHLPGIAVMESRYKVGEVVAIAECYKDVLEEIGRDSLRNPLVEDAGYMNKMFVRAGLMPHRIRITNVRVERLQDISDEDCLREGIYKDPAHGGVPDLYAFETCRDQYGYVLAKQWYKTPRKAFSALIDKVSGKGTYGNNHWVFVYEFELVK